ncbi:MAG: hypothetical protein JNK94_07180 [Hyphomonadaceae bacterium]|nr:hypothetical protein [Hyphomonadaceae bacterium]MBX3510939.1 hypothetical protein [Hyphomonadaceae bacterium]
MAPIIEGPPEEGEAPRPLGKRLLWFVALWLVSLIGVAAIAYSLRALIL